MVWYSIHSLTLYYPYFYLVTFSTKVKYYPIRKPAIPKIDIIVLAYKAS